MVSKMTAKEIKELEAEKRYWERLTDFVDSWQLMGWTYRRSATYVTTGHYGPHHQDTIVMTGRQRDDLIRAFEELKENYYEMGRRDGVADAEPASN